MGWIQKNADTLVLQNEWIEVEIGLRPFFVLRSFRDKKDGRELCVGSTARIVADRETVGGFQLLKTGGTDSEYILCYRAGDLMLERHLFFYRNAPAVRYYDILVSGSDYAAMYYSSLLALTFRSAPEEAECIEFFSTTDHSNHRLLRHTARPGKNVGGYFLTRDLFLYKEAPMPDSRPIKGEYDFLWNPEILQLEMVGLGFDNLHRDEPRRANGVVIGLRRDCGLQHYQLERYGESEPETLSNSWPSLHLDVTEKVIEKELEAAAESGISTVFIDDGYFSEFMGDIDTEKFPHRFSALAARAKKLHLELGLWANPLGLDIRHPKMALWDGTENRDFQQEPPKWNWLARTNDYQAVELQGGSRSERSYSPIELMDPECFAFMKDKLVGYWREYGIRKFKFDLYQLSVLNTLCGDAQLHYEAYRRLLSELQSEIPGLVISMDITRRNRPSFDFGLDFGRLFIENRDRNYSDHRYYHPYLALGNFHQTAQFVPAQRIELEMMPQLAEYSVSYTAGTTVFATPLYWGLIADLEPERRKELREFFAFMMPLRKRWANCVIVPVDETPCRGNWSAVLALAPDGKSGWLGVYRHGAENSSYIPGLQRYAVRQKLWGIGTAQCNGEKCVFSESDRFAFSLYEIECFHDFIWKQSRGTP